MTQIRGTRTLSTHIGAGMLAIALAFTVAGCSASAPQASPTGPASPRPTTSPDSATSAPTSPPPTQTGPPVAADPVATSCDTLLTPAGYAQLDEDGLEPRDGAGGNADLTAMIQAAGGIVCTWERPSTDITAVVGAAPLDSALWESISARLIESGFTPDDSTFAGFLIAPTTGQDHPTGGVVHADGHIYYVSAPQILDWIPALQS